MWQVKFRTCNALPSSKAKSAARPSYREGRLDSIELIDHAEPIVQSEANTSVEVGRWQAEFVSVRKPNGTHKVGAVPHLDNEWRWYRFTAITRLLQSTRSVTPKSANRDTTSAKMRTSSAICSHFKSACGKFRHVVSHAQGTRSLVASEVRPRPDPVNGRPPVSPSTVGLSAFNKTSNRAAALTGRFRIPLQYYLCQHSAKSQHDSNCRGLSLVYRYFEVDDQYGQVSQYVQSPNPDGPLELEKVINITGESIVAATDAVKGEPQCLRLSNSNNREPEYLQKLPPMEVEAPADAEGALKAGVQDIFIIFEDTKIDKGMADKSMVDKGTKDPKLPFDAWLETLLQLKSRVSRCFEPPTVCSTGLSTIEMRPNRPPAEESLRHHHRSRRDGPEDMIRHSLFVLPDDPQNAGLSREFSPASFQRQDDVRKAGTQLGDALSLVVSSDHWKSLTADVAIMPSSSMPAMNGTASQLLHPPQNRSSKTSASTRRKLDTHTTGRRHQESPKTFREPAKQAKMTAAGLDIAYAPPPSPSRAVEACKPCPTRRPPFQRSDQTELWWNISPPPCRPLPSLPPSSLASGAGPKVPAPRREAVPDFNASYRNDHSINDGKAADRS